MNKSLISAVCLLLVSTVSKSDGLINNANINEAPFPIYNTTTPAASPTTGMRLDFWCNSNTLDESTKTITFNNVYKEEVYGYGGQVGWDFSSSVLSVSDYKYLVVSLNNSSAPSKVQIRLCNQKASENDRGYVPMVKNSDNTYDESCIKTGSNHVDIDLHNGYFRDQLKDDNHTTDISTVDIKTLYSMRFWEFTGNGTVHKINLSNVFLTNTLPSWNSPVSRSTTTGNYGTVCLSYPATAENAYIYTVSGKSTDGKTIYISYYNGLLQAGVPYIYKSLSDAGVKFYQIENSTLVASAGTAPNGLTGCLSATSITKDANCYVLKNNQWYLVHSDNFKCGANRAYINMTDMTVVTSSAKAMSMDVQGELTAINAAEVNDDGGNEATYSITGMKIDSDKNLPKGLYIRGGKKFIVK